MSRVIKTDSPDDKICAMGNSEGDIVIPRSKLPGVDILGGVSINGPTLYHVPASSVYAAQLREDVYERLAIAEAIDRTLAEQADKKLDEEARALSCRVDGVPPHQYVNLAYWRKIARAAREVYGIK